MKKLKFMMFMLVWKRPEITEIVFNQIKHLQKFYDIQLLVCYSEKSYLSMIEKYGFIPFFHENLPLGRKNNAAVQETLKYKWDVLIQTGSDDLLSEELFKIYDFSHAVGGLNSCYFVDLKQNYVGTYENKFFPVGAGRFFSRFLIERFAKNYEIYLQQVLITKSTTKIGYAYQPTEKIYVMPDVADLIIKHGLGVNFPVTSENKTAIISKEILDKFKYCSNFVRIKRKIQAFHMWPDELNSGLDTASHNYLLSQGYTISVFPDLRPLIIDLKSNTNIHAIDEFSRIEMDFQTLFKNFKHLSLC